MQPRSDLPTLGRLLLLALLALLLVSHAPQAAAQQASIGYVRDTISAVHVQQRQQSNTHIVTEYWDNADRYLGFRVCSAPGICTHTPPAGAARYAMALEYDGSREELVGESCNGVASSLPQGQCINGPLRVSMRVRAGLVRWRFQADERPGRLYAPSFGSFGNVARLQFPATDGSNLGPKYWDAREFRSTVDGIPTAAGDYDLVMPEMSGHCRPVRTNPNERVSVREGQTTEFIVRYTGTRCTMAVQNYASTPAAAGTITSDPPGLNCSAAAVFSSCRAEFDFDSTVRIIASPASGWQASFGRNFTGCSRDEPNPGVCQILADGNRELSVQFNPATAPPPPPPPVTLSAALGSATPADGSADKGSQAAPLLQLLLTPANGVARVNALTLQASGSGRDDLDLGDIRLYQDSNGNGLVDAGEPLLASGRVLADNGSLRLALATPLELSQATPLLLVTDIASTVHSAAAAGGVLTAMGLFALALPAGRRRMRLGLPVLLVGTALLLSACLSGDDAEEPLAADPPAVQPPVAPPPPPAPPAPVTYRLQISAIEATDAATPPAVLDIGGLPLTGAVISVQP